MGNEPSVLGKNKERGKEREGGVVSTAFTQEFALAFLDENIEASRRSYPRDALSDRRDPSLTEPLEPLFSYFRIA